MAKSSLPEPSKLSIVKHSSHDIQGNAEPHSLGINYKTARDYKQRRLSMPAVKGDSSDAQVAGVQATNTATDGTGLLAISDHGIGLEVRGGERAALFTGEVDLITSSLCVMRPVLFPGSPGHPPKVGEPIKVSELGKDGCLILRDQ
jgi:hypothetical protein